MIPLTIRKVLMRHSGGTKEYHVVVIKRSDGGSSLTIKRWGKRGTWGQLDFYTGSAIACVNEAEKKIREKEKRGYYTFTDDTHPVDSFGEFKRILGFGYLKDLGGHIDSLIPGLSEEEKRGMKSAAPPAFDEDGDPTYAKRKPKLLDEKAIPEPTTEEKVAQNPMWGAF